MCRKVVILMPRSTYFHLETEKRRAIFDAGKKEFTTYSLHDASVNRIVKQAGIPKGSFYQYFDNKEEFYWYIVETLIYSKLGDYQDILRKVDGDIFRAEEQIVRYLLNLVESDETHELMKHVFQDSYIALQRRISESGISIYYQMYELLLSYGFPNLNIRSKEDFVNVFQMIRNITNHTVMMMILQNMTKRDALKLYETQMELLQRGITRRRSFLFGG